MTQRFSAPQAEAKYQWLKTILDTFYISDALVVDHLARVSKKGVKPACHRGCDACCRKPTVPFTAPELKAISWYASEVLEGEVRQNVKQRLRSHEETLECPFLVDHACSIYPVRPLICRQFMVKSKPCIVDEDIATDRPDDIIPLPRDSVIQPVAMRLLDAFDIKSTAKKQRAFASGFIAANARYMHEYDWNNIARTMDQFDGGA
jgi:Fe-S-cluster containining protein